LVHKNRKDAEVALQKRMKDLGKMIWECHSRIVWTENNVKPGEFMTPNQFSNWRPGEVIPEGEIFSDSD